MLVRVYVATFLLALVAASPAPAVQKRSFKVPRVANEKFTGKNGPQALAKAYRKFGMTMPEDLSSAMEAQAEVKLARRRNRHPAIFHSGSKRRGGNRNGGGNGNANANAGANANGNANGNGNGNGINDGNGNGVNNGNGNGNGVNNGNGNGNPQPVVVGAPDQGNQTGGGGQAGGQTGEVENDPEPNDTEFLSPVKIGGQTLTLDFDTGSSDLWVFNKQLGNDITAGHSTYDFTKSQTFAPMNGATFDISYGDGSGASGNVGTDVVDLGGASFDKQAVELATNVSDSFVKDQNNDGLLGLAFSSINTVKPQKAKTFFDNVMPSLQEPVFTADLRKGAAGSYEFGVIDNAKFQGQMAWVPIDNSQGFWQFSSESFAVDGGQPQAGAKGGQAIADTGTTLILADPSIVQGYYSQVQGAQNNKQAGGVTVPCNAKLPDLDLDIGGQYMARINGADLNFAPVNQQECFGGLQATTQGGLGVYGDILFKSQFVAFNGGNNSIGLAPHA